MIGAAAQPAGRPGPVTPGDKGRFGDFDVLNQVEHWDAVTASVVLARLDLNADLSFFTVVEEPVVRALLDLLLAQHDEPKVPVTELIDRRLTLGETDGWRYDDMPEDAEAWRRSLAALDGEARTGFGKGFSQLDPDDQGRIIQAVQDAKEWHGFNAAHLWSLWTRYAGTAFYSHPWAWNEMGFGGPAYPRGYKNMGIDKAERWERSEVNDGDPVPWAERREAAQKAHAERLGSRDRAQDGQPLDVNQRPPSGQADGAA